MLLIMLYIIKIFLGEKTGQKRSSTSKQAPSSKRSKSSVGSLHTIPERGENAADKTAENIHPENGGDEVFRYNLLLLKCSLNTRLFPRDELFFPGVISLQRVLVFSLKNVINHL